MSGGVPCSHWTHAVKWYEHFMAARVFLLLYIILTYICALVNTLRRKILILKKFLLTFDITCGIICISTWARKGESFLWACRTEGRADEIRTEGRWEYMTVFEALYLMVQTGVLVIALITLIVMLMIYIGTNNTKK